MTIGERIKHYREESEMSITDVCQACKIHPESLSRWEQDYLQPNAENLIKLSSVLGVPVDWLLGTKGKYTRYNLALSIGEKVRLKRGNKTRKEFTYGYFITSAALAAIENGKTKNVHTSTLIDLSGMTGMSVAWLLGLHKNHEQHITNLVNRRLSIRQDIRQ